VSPAGAAGRWRRSIWVAGSAFPTSPTRRSSMWTRSAATLGRCSTR
jgi:hypothetical protein